MDDLSPSVLQWNAVFRHHQTKHHQGDELTGVSLRTEQWRWQNSGDVHVVTTQDETDPGAPLQDHPPSGGLPWVPTWLLPWCWPHRSPALRWCGRRSPSRGRWSCPRCWWHPRSELGGPCSSAVPGGCLPSPLPHRSFFSVHSCVALPALTSTPTHLLLALRQKLVPRHSLCVLRMENVCSIIFSSWFSLFFLM